MSSSSRSRSRYGASAEETRRSNALDVELRAAHLARTRRNTNSGGQFEQVLLIGSPGAGKSTLTMQLRAEDVGFTSEERRSYTEAIRTSALASMRTLCREATRPAAATTATTSEVATTAAAVSSLDDANSEIEIEIEIESGELHSLRESVLNAAHLTEALAPTIARLWSTDVAIQSAYQRRHDLFGGFHLDQSAKYLLDQIAMIASPHYIPSEQDLVHVAGSLPAACRAGLCESSFTFLRPFERDFPQTRYEFLDVSRVRGAPRKWLRCFDHIESAVIFVASLADYDRIAVSSRSAAPRNALVASLDLFESICDRPELLSTRIIVLLTHKDRLAEKLFASPLEAHFPQFTGRPGNYEDAAAFIREQFDLRDPQGHARSISIHVHFLNTLDRENVKLVFGAVNEHIFRRHIASCELH